ENQRKESYQVINNFIDVYQAMGNILLNYANGKNIAIDSKIYFYDDNFQSITDTGLINSDNFLQVAERCLNESLKLARIGNFLLTETNLNVAFAELEWQKIRNG